mgnify:CR=1 FL=1
MFPQYNARFSHDFETIEAIRYRDDPDHNIWDTMIWYFSLEREDSENRKKAFQNKEFDQNWRST